MRSDVDVLPIRHHISKYTHGGLMARYDRPSHPLAVPSISPYSIFFQGDWSFEATATMTWMCFQSAIKHLFPRRRGGSVFEPTDNVQHRNMRRSGSAFEPDITNSSKPTYTNLPRQVELRNLTYD